jgi:hypothetical protein
LVELHHPWPADQLPLEVESPRGVVAVAAHAREAAPRRVPAVRAAQEVERPPRVHVPLVDGKNVVAVPGLGPLPNDLEAGLAALLLATKTEFCNLRRRRLRRKRGKLRRPRTGRGWRRSWRRRGAPHGGDRRARSVATGGRHQRQGGV